MAGSPIYGELLKAQFENLNADITGSPVPTGIAYYNTVSNLLKYYDGGATAWRTLVTENSTQTLTGKTISTGTLLTCVIDDYIDINEESAPSTPASGKVRVYAKSDGKLYRKDDAGNEYELGAGGSGELNVVDNPADANAGWTASGAGITVTTTTSATDLPLAGIFDTAIKITPVSGTDYVYYRWTMPASLKNKKLKVEWHQRPLSGYADGDLKVEVYKNSASNYGGSYTEFALSTDSSGTSSIPNISGRYLTTFDADDGDYYELRIVRVSGTTALNLVNVIIGPGTSLQGAVVGPWISWTPTGTWVSNTTYTGRYRRVGDTAEFWIKITTSGAPTSASLNVNLPSGLTIDTSKMSADITQSLGLTESDDSGSNFYMGRVEYQTTTSVRLGVTGASGTYTNNNTITEAVPFTWGAGDTCIATFKVPILEWANSGVLSVIGDDQQVQNSRVIVGDSTTSVPNNTFTTPIYASETFDTVSSYNLATGIYTAKRDEFVFADGTFTFTGIGTGVDISTRAFVNGTTALKLMTSKSDNGGKGFWTGMVRLNRGDTLQIQVSQNSGSSKNLNGSTLENTLQFFSIADYTAGQPLGFTTAQDGIAGLMERASRVQRKNLSSDNAGTSPATAVGDLSFNNLVDGRWYTVIVVMYEVGNSGHLWLKWGSSASNANYAYFRTPTANTTYCYIHTFQVSGTDLDVYHGGGSSTWQDQDGNDTPSGFTGGTPKSTYAILIEHPNVVTTTAFT